MVFYFRFTQNQTGFQQFDNNMALTTYVTLVCRLKVDSVVLFWPFYYRWARRYGSLKDDTL